MPYSHTFSGWLNVSSCSGTFSQTSNQTAKTKPWPEHISKPEHHNTANQNIAEHLDHSTKFGLKHKGTVIMQDLGWFLIGHNTRFNWIIMAWIIMAWVIMQGLVWSITVWNSARFGWNQKSLHDNARFGLNHKGLRQGCRVWVES